MTNLIDLPAAKVILPDTDIREALKEYKKRLSKKIVFIENPGYIVIDSQIQVKGKSSTVKARFEFSLTFTDKYVSVYSFYDINFTLCVITKK